MSGKNDSPGKMNNIKCTPPTKIKVRNPFDKVLIERLHKPLCSPGMCKIYKKKNNGSFRWDIDQACTLVPTDIVACNSQFEPSPDPLLEKIAEEANDKFFSQEMVMPSPLEPSKKIKPLLQASFDSSVQFITSKQKGEMKDVSAQTTLTLPPSLPPELERMLQPFCTYSQEQDMYGEYEITVNGSLRRKLYFEEHSDVEHDDSEHTDDEVHLEQRPPSNCEAHTPIIFSPDLSRDLVARGMRRTFGTPVQKHQQAVSKPCYRNKILDVVDFGEPCFSPIEFRTPKRCGQESATSSSLASASISPVTKATSSDEDKNNVTSPESEAMATCLDCIVSQSDSSGKKSCFCKITPNKSSLKRSTSLRDTPQKNRRGSVLSEKRSLSMSSLHRSRSVQKLDFSVDMSVDGSFNNMSHADSESSSPERSKAVWSIQDNASILQLVKKESSRIKTPEHQSSINIYNTNTLDETPIKGNRKSNMLSHEISRIRASVQSPMHMSLDNSLDNFDIPPSMENKKIDFNNVDLKFLTENVSQVEYGNSTKVTSDNSCSFKRVDSGFNENTFYANASSYYESAIKPSELTVTNASREHSSKAALKEISNTNWMRVDSGFKDETSTDSTQFYSESSMKKTGSFAFDSQDKENIEDFDRFLVQAGKSETMSDIFTDELAFNCNFSSTPSKNKPRKINS